MRTELTVILVLLGVAAVGAATEFYYQSRDARIPAAFDAPVVTPPGITLQSVRIGMKGPEAGGGQGASHAPAPLKVVYADAGGKTAYFFANDTPGNSVCIDSCAKTWLPVAASNKAKPSGDWSI